MSLSDPNLDLMGWCEVNNDTSVCPVSCLSAIDSFVAVVNYFLYGPLLITGLSDNSLSYL